MRLSRHRRIGECQLAATPGSGADERRLDRFRQSEGFGNDWLHRFRNTIPRLERQSGSAGPPVERRIRVPYERGHDAHRGLQYRRHRHGRYHGPRAQFGRDVRLFAARPDQHGRQPEAR